MDTTTAPYVVTVYSVRTGRVICDVPARDVWEAHRVAGERRHPDRFIQAHVHDRTPAPEYHPDDIPDRRR